MKQWTANQQNISDAGIWEDKLDPSTEYQKNIYLLFQVISKFSRLSRVLTTLLMLHIEINRFQYLCPGLNVVVVAAYVIA